MNVLNAVAGPSMRLVNHSSPSSSSSSPPQSPSVQMTLTTAVEQLPPPPLLYLPPPVPPPPKQHLASTQDLISRFKLLPAYDKYVRPFAPVVLSQEGSANQGATPHDQLGHTASSLGPGAVNSPGVLGTASPMGGIIGVDKGKGRELPLGMGMGTGGSAGQPGAGDVDQQGKDDGGDGDDDDGPSGKGDKKKKNSYKHLIKGIPGKHSLKKDTYLTKMMLEPPKNRVRITQFDAKTQDDAFTVSLEGLKGWNINALVLESAQAREDRKKRKELKKLAKLHGQGAAAAAAGAASTPTSTVPPTSALHPATAAGTPRASVMSRTSTPLPQTAQSSTNIQAPIPTPVGAGSVKRVATSTPRPGSSAGGTAGTGASSTPRPASTVPRPGSTVPRPGSAVPRPGSAVPRPGSAAALAKQQQQQQLGQGQAGQQQQSRPHTVSQPVPQKPIMASQHQGPIRAGTPMDVDTPLSRGKKRDREDGAAINGVNGHGAGAYGSANGNGNGAYGNGNAQQVRASAPVNGNAAPSVMASANAKAGTGGVRPRPIKKQRMDVQGQSRDVSGPVQQQPTPQGV